MSIEQQGQDEGGVDIEIVRTAGSGLKGNVFRGKQTDLDRIVAIKFIKPEFGGSALEHGKRVAKIAVHPNVASVYQVAQLVNPKTGQLADALVMEWVDGCKLGDLLTKRIARCHAQKICTGLLDGISHFHRSGVSHNDLHPGNVLIQADFTPKIIDPDEERYSTLNKLSAASTGNAKEDDLLYCRDLIFKICSVSELPYQAVVGESDAIRNAASLTELGKIVESLFATDVPDVCVNQDDVNSVARVKAKAIFQQGKERILAGNFHDLQVDKGTIVLGMVPLQDVRFDFEEMRNSIPDPIFRSNGWSYSTRATSLASINRGKNDCVRSVAQINDRGTIFAADRFYLDPLFHPYNDNRFASDACCSAIVKAFARFIATFAKLGYEGDVLVSVMLLEFANFRMFSEDPTEFPEFTDIEIVPPPIEFALADVCEGGSPGNMLKPAFDFIWREFGYDRCFHYTNRGEFNLRIL
jgi:hypothetical protein